MGGMKLKRATSALAAAVLGGWASLALAVGDMPGGPKVNQLNLHEPVTKVAAEVYWLNTYVMWVCVVIFIAVFGAMSWAIWKHRKSKGYKAATFHESTAVEITWTIVPFFIIIALALPATKMVIEQKDTSSADVTIKATGYQWRWGYDYLNGEGEGISFLSTLSTPREQIENRAPKSDTYLMEVDNPVVVPVNRKVRVVLTANDVVHAWMVPAFGVKQDAIPGFIRDLWFRAEKVGVYRGQCAELCGKDHAFMPIVVDVRSDEDYAKWVGEKKQEMLASQDDPNKVWTQAELQARGEKVFQANCVACHQANGKGVPGAFPALAGSPVVLGPHAAQLDVVMHGRPGTAMASFKQLSDVEMAAVITYTRHAWGNDAKDGLIQPSEVAAARK
jgi:cytochrome c oxidase subunit 2